MPQGKTGDAGWPGTGASGNQALAELVGTLSSSSGTNLTDTLAVLSQSITNLVPATQAQAEALTANTEAIVQDTSVHSAGAVADTLGKVTSTFTGGLLGSLSPILSGVLSLFGGGGSSTPPPLTSYIPPPSLTFQSANVPGAAIPGADFGQSGSARAIGSPQPPAQQITVQVQAMDSQSFMDHSQEIAQAVRDAILNMHSLNDVISDL